MWPAIISDLRDTHTQAEIAEHCGVSQAQISRLGSGKHQPLWPLGDRLLKLHRQRRQPVLT